LTLRQRSWISSQREGRKRIDLHFRTEPDDIVSKIIEEFARNHNITLTDAAKTLLFIADQTIKLAERGFDVADYSESL